MVYLVVPEATPVASGAVSVRLRKIYADPRFWRLAPLSATCIGTAWALQGLWAAQWLTDVEGLDRTTMVLHLFAMAIALSLGAILIGLAADRLRRRGVGPEVLLGLVATVFITAQLALILRWPLPSYFLRAVVGGGRCGNRAQLCDFGRIFSQRAHRAGQRGAESVPHRCSVRCAIRDRLRASALDASSGALSRNRVLDSLCFQSRPPDRGVGLVRASASPNALAAANAHAIQRSRFDPDGPLRPIHQ